MLCFQHTVIPTTHDTLKTGERSIKLQGFSPRKKNNRTVHPGGFLFCENDAFAPDNPQE